MATLFLFLLFTNTVYTIFSLWSMGDGNVYIHIALLLD